MFCFIQMKSVIHTQENTLLTHFNTIKDFAATVSFGLI